MGILYGNPLSTFTRKVRIALAEKGIDYSLKPIAMGRQSPALVAINPLGKVPVYETDGIVVPDSSVIIAFLEKTVPTPALYPADPAPFAHALFYEEYADTRLREASAAFFYQRVVRGIFQKQPVDESALAAAAPVRDECFAFLESQFGQQPWLVGDELTVADVAVTAQLITLEQGGETPDADRWPRLAGYLAAMCARPVVATLLDEERRLIPSV